MFLLLLQVIIKCIFVKRKNMYRSILFFVFLCSSTLWSQQLVINELDANDLSTDNEEFIELKSSVPNFSTDGFILVFFNGNDASSANDRSYLVLDLNGYTTDGNGLLVLGNLDVSPSPQVIISNGLFQNGVDAVGIYETSASNFPDFTLATTTDLVDALVYDTDDSNSNSGIDTVLLGLLNETVQYAEGSAFETHSLQLQNDGTFLSALPTPRQLNDGSGIVFNAIEISTNQVEYSEGEIFDIIFTTDTPVNAAVTFNISLNNGTFNTADFSGTTSITISAGQNTASTTITLIDDLIDEGDEVLKIQFLDLEVPFVASNNLVEVRVVDNDFTIAQWGTPLNPTNDKVISTAPIDYYSSLNNKSGQDLRDAIQAIIADPNTVRAQTYADVLDILNEADQNPENSNEVWLMYTEEGRPKLDVQVSSDGSGKWNREHTFPRSRAGYESIEEDDIADGIDVFWPTNADILRHGNSDAHGLRAVDAGENSSRGNLHYGPGEYEGPTGNAGSFKGDVARSVLFLELRYNGLQIVNGYPSSEPKGFLGDLTTLLSWHLNDPPDDFEMNRNNVVYEWQKNRNPLIDMPLLADYVWGNKVGLPWFNTLSLVDNQLENFNFYPNPTDNKIYFTGIQNTAKFEIFTIEGKKIKTLTVEENNSISLDLSSGLYLLKVTENEKSKTHKIIIK